MPRVAIVIPSYNHARYIAAAVHSVLEQTESDLELLVVDDGSTDDSLTVLAQCSDPRLRVVSQSNHGAHAAINHGIALTTAPYIAILNSDDLYHPQRLERLLPFVEADPMLGLVGSHIEVIDSMGKPLGIKRGYENLSPWPLALPAHSFRAGDDLRAAFLTENYFATTSNYLFSRAWYAQVGGFRNLRYAHDWDFGLRLARHAHLALVSEPLLQYRLHPTNTIRENQTAMVFEICWCLAVHLPQHIRDEAWFIAAPVEQRITQLLHSIYTFGCESVLSVLLLQDLAHNPNKALHLLEPDNPERLAYLEWIARCLATMPPQAQPGIWPKLKALFRR